MDPQRLTLRELELALAAVEPAVVLVAPRVLRRVIRIGRRLTTVAWDIPHRKSYAISRDRLFEFVDRFELELSRDRDLQETVILLERPGEEDLMQRSAGNLLRDYWRLLFHIRIHLAMDHLIAAGQLSEDSVLERLRELGGTEYAEIRGVLLRENMLLPPRSDLMTYVEFAAVFLELYYFAPEQLAWWFPGIRDPEPVARMLSRDVDHELLVSESRLAGAAVSGRVGGDGEESFPEAVVPDVTPDPLRPSPPAYWRLIARAEKVSAVGNAVKAAILRQKAARQALPDRARGSEELARAELERLARRLQPVLQLSDAETQDWGDALAPLLIRADQGLRTAEAKVLYDLQKVCVEHERGVYALDLVEWARRLGRIPLRRNLPLLRQVLMAKHLQGAARRLSATRLTGLAQSRLAELIAVAVDRARQSLRDRLRPEITAALEQEGLRPRNVPERVAFRKIVEELLDRIVERGHLNFGQLRDTLSQNNLKLPDLTSLWELLTGDMLLRIDSRLAEALDGVYRRGPVYLRWSQRLSAMAFGTQFGRGFTQHVALPFGGAYLLLESLRHILNLFVPVPLDPAEISPQPLATPAPEVIERSLPQPLTLAQVTILGAFLWLLIHRQEFRSWCLKFVRKGAQVLRVIAYDWPLAVFSWPWIRRFFDSPLYAVCISYLLKPLLVTALVVSPFAIRFEAVTWATWSIAFLVINLLLNSPLGRYADEVITEHVLRGWRELQIRVLAATFRAVMDLFQWLLQTVERLLYAVDEWLRFRRGESWWILAFKAVFGVVWSVMAYIVRIYITLLIEPQVNPIKHFPVVTVSHKMMLPFSLHLTALLAAPLAPLGKFWSNAIAGTTVFLLPGVFGFLVWELKENWRLYAANRSKSLRAIPIGSHGETMLRFLRIGFHSGTIPRLFGRLREAAREAQETGKWNAVQRLRDNLHHVQDSIRHFVERELIALLEETGEWCGIPLRAGAIQFACNHVTLEVRRADEDAPPCRLEFQERTGWIIVSVLDEGWLGNLDAGHRATFYQALAGFFKAAGVDIVWQDLVKYAGFESTWYDFSPDGVLFWPQLHQHSAVLYRFRDTGSESSWPVPIRAVVEPSPLERRELLFREQPIPWNEWVELWNGREPAAPVESSQVASSPVS